MGKLLNYNKSNAIIYLFLLGGQEKVFVVKYGSDAFKTYLPDSDIDFTVIRRDYVEG